MLRRTSENKKPLKEKIILHYDSIFKGEDKYADDNRFWDEFFLLKANAAYLEKKFESLPIKDLNFLTNELNQLFLKCCEYVLSENIIRMINALQTMIVLFRMAQQHQQTAPSNDEHAIIKPFTTNFHALIHEVQLQLLLRTLTSILADTPLSKDDDYEVKTMTSHPTILKRLALKLLLTMACVTDNIHENPFVEFMMIEGEKIENSLIEILVSPTERVKYGKDVLLLLVLLVNYRKYESVNPFIMKISVLDNELALNGFASVISSSLSTFNKQFMAKQEDSKPTGIFSTITSMVGSMFVGVSEEQKKMIKTNEPVLLALYEAVHLNRNFITILTHSHTDDLIVTPPTTPKIEDVSKTPTLNLNDVGTTNNVLCTFIQYTSIVMQDNKMKQNRNSTKLCFLILTCITEDLFANSFLHDDNMQFYINIHRMPMRHRKVRSCDDGKSRVLACWLFDLITEYMISHMMKDLPVIQHMRCVGIIHRLMNYQKRCGIRLQYQWKELWSALLTFVKYIISNENLFVNNWKGGIFVLLTQVLNIFNLFILHGDTFLSDASSYDLLYYEIVRMAHVFESLYSIVLKYSSHSEYKEYIYRLSNSLINVRSVTRHFSPKIDEYSKINNLSSLTEEEVLNVVRKNYESLNLRVEENLESYERYSERPKESLFFSDLVRSIAMGYRKNFTFPTLNLQPFSSF